jgi:hypothetical protein
MKERKNLALREILKSKKYLWTFLILEALILITPICLAFLFHNIRLLWLLPISFILSLVILFICLEIENKYGE